MRRFSFLAAMTMCLFSVASAGSGKYLACNNVANTETTTSTAPPPPNPFTTNGFLRTDIFPNSAGFGGPIPASAEIVSLSVVIAPGLSCVASGGVVEPGAADIKIGLYDGTVGSGFPLLTTTDNIHLTPDQTKGGADPSGSVLASFAPVVLGLGANNYYIGVSSSNPNLCLFGGGVKSNPSQTSDYSAGGDLPTTLTGSPTANSDFNADATVCNPGDIIQDPVFRGFNGQHFIVKGEAGAVFNLISSETMSFNNRFISLESENDSMTAAAMKEVRAQSAKQSKMASLFKSAARPPVTAAWNHPGTYMGESGLTLGESQLYVAPGAYATGFASITLDGVELAVSDKAVELDGDITVYHPSAYKVTITTPSVRFSIVNADHFVNIEHAIVLSTDEQLSGLLGQTASPEWEVVQSAEFKQHIENDYKLASNKLF